MAAMLDTTDAVAVRIALKGSIESRRKALILKAEERLRNAKDEAGLASEFLRLSGAEDPPNICKGCGIQIVEFKDDECPPCLEIHSRRARASSDMQ